RIIRSAEPPKIVRGGSLDSSEADAMRMFEDGFDFIGVSYFNDSASRGDANVLEQATKLGASVVRIYAKYTHTVSGVSTYSLPDVQTTNTNIQGTVFGSGRSATISGSATST